MALFVTLGRVRSGMPANAKSTSGASPLTICAMLLPEPQECVHPSVPWPVFRNRFGSFERPMSDAELEEKFRDNANIGGFPDRADAAIAALWELDAAPDGTKLMASLG